MGQTRVTSNDTYKRNTTCSAERRFLQWKKSRSFRPALYSILYKVLVTYNKDQVAFQSTSFSHIVNLRWERSQRKEGKKICAVTSERKAQKELLFILFLVQPLITSLTMCITERAWKLHTCPQFLWHRFSELLLQHWSSLDPLTGHKRTAIWGPSS